MNTIETAQAASDNLKSAEKELFRSAMEGDVRLTILNVVMSLTTLAFLVYCAVTGNFIALLAYVLASATYDVNLLYTTKD